jgi:hypothetical protein
MNRKLNTRAIIAILTTFGVLACVTMDRDLVRNGTVKIEKVSSAWGTVGFVSVTQEAEEVWLRGQVRRRPSGRGPIPGHIDLEVIDPEGNVLEKLGIDYDRPSPKSRYANFHAVLTATPPPGSTIRVTHDSHVV